MSQSAALGGYHTRSRSPYALEDTITEGKQARAGPVDPPVRTLLKAPSSTHHSDLAGKNHLFLLSLSLSVCPEPLFALN